MLKYKGEYVLTFGKYKGEKLENIACEDNGYYKWLCKNSGTVQKIIEQYRQAKKNSCINKLTVSLSTPCSYSIYQVNVHSVGLEYRIKTHNFGTISIEEVVNDQYSISTFEDETVPLTKEEYQELKDIVRPLWIEGGKLVEDRGLY